MKFGLLAIVDDRAGIDPARRLERLLEAEEQGYDSLWLAGPDLSTGHLTPAVLQAAAQVAVRTTSIGIGLVGAPPAHLHPLRLAEDLAVLDLISAGRLAWAFGMGDEEALRSEQLEIILRAWSGARFAHRGARFDFPELACVPVPLQRPHPLLFGKHGDAAGAWAGARGQGVFVDPFTAARRLADPGMSTGPRLLARAVWLGEGAHAAPEGWPTQHAISGAVAACRDLLLRIEKEYAPDSLLVCPDVSGGDEDELTICQRRFMGEVVSQATPGGG